MKKIIHLLLTLALYAGTYHAAAQVPFTLSSSLTNASGSFLQNVTAADVNNDGKTDLICIRGNPSLVYVWTNSGGGGFALSASYAVGSFPYQVIAVDVNHDGRPDLVTVNNSGKSITVLTNDGTGALVLAATMPLGTPSSPHSVAAADFNGDGRPDLVVANSQAATFTVWTNGGGGIFVSNTSFSVGTPQLTVPQSVTTADVNGDEKPDIIGVNNGSGTYLRVWTNNGTGGFVAAPVPNPGSGATWVTAADLNGDGKPDLILDTGQVTVYLNNGSGGFVFSANYPVGVNPYAVVAADVNGDGAVDVITPNQGNNTLTVLTNNGSGILGSNTTVNVGSGPQSLTTADVNSDGRADLISGNWNVDSLTVVTNAATFMPRLALKRSGSVLLVSWSALWMNWSLQQSTNLATGGWTAVGGTIGNDGTTQTVTNAFVTAPHYFRLSNP